ncbi:unnamed protein product [Schistosoma mattheei]|uniref:Uncharacterized protein n=1 Tax=Schistosoma mattheei TaxID=31246 RepID=A0A183Q2X6_9TREM|nr:unnamed protein product [Schistosoma mattheei]
MSKKIKKRFQCLFDHAYTQRKQNRIKHTTTNTTTTTNNNNNNNINNNNSNNLLKTNSCQIIRSMYEVSKPCLSIEN